MTLFQRAQLVKSMAKLDGERFRNYSEADHLDLADKTAEQIEEMERAMGFRSLDAYCEEQMSPSDATFR